MQGFLGLAARKVASRASEGRACGLSFSADTPVETPTGEQAIATLQPGDAVQAYDSTSDAVTTQHVVKVWINHDTDRLDVTLVADRGDTAESSTASQTAAEAGPTKAQQAAQGDGTRAPPAQEEDDPQAQTDPQSQTPTDHAQHRDASSSTASAAEHGSETIHTTAKHPWLTADHGWVVAGQLTVGEQVRRADGTTAQVVALTTVSGVGPMWDLTLDGVHTFAMGAGAYVVHNCGGGKPSLAGYSEAHNAANAANAAKLKTYARLVDKYGEPRHLSDGRVRFYGDAKPPETSGRIAGTRYVKEWNPRTGQTRGWMESFEHDGSVRIVHPKDINGVHIQRPHHLFDHGRYEGRF